ncbi:ATPase inhibitor mai-2, mitochondrial [Uranotaenia lowii]|uniref:ATPase inhibitor mai-2, mitochondrial n=1 Tax=Uranotaenia lowii TaxID=190385 RepID=UPI0024794412|nr:ATPase inhibitor mai-2, mitochondrial [Uranotaenia lowii]
MFSIQRNTTRLYPSALRIAKMSQVGDLGAGAGKGGGGGGSIREAGGSFGKMEAAHEEEYFYKQQREQLQQLKTKTDSGSAGADGKSGAGAKK